MQVGGIWNCVLSKQRPREAPHALGNYLQAFRQVIRQQLVGKTGLLSLPCFHLWGDRQGYGPQSIYTMTE